MFFGTYTPKLDDKGRLTLPAKFRDDLLGGVMITKGQDHSLSVYLRDDFAELAGRARAAAKNSVQARATARTLAANTDEQRLDSQGRITLPVEHRRYAGLTKECVVIGAVDHLEIWDADAWRRYQDEHEETYSQAGIESLDAIL